MPRIQGVLGPRWGDRPGPRAQARARARSALPGANRGLGRIRYIMSTLEIVSSRKLNHLAGPISPIFNMRKRALSRQGHGTGSCSRRLMVNKTRGRRSLGTLGSGQGKLPSPCVQARMTVLMLGEHAYTSRVYCAARARLGRSLGASEQGIFIENQGKMRAFDPISGRIRTGGDPPAAHVVGQYRPPGRHGQDRPNPDFSPKTGSGFSQKPGRRG